MKQAEFEHLAPRIRLKAMAAALGMTADKARAEDIAQDVMLRLWTLCADIDGISHAERLASRMAHNLAIDGERRRHTVPLTAGGSMTDGNTATPDEALESKEDMRWLEERLARLPSTEYQILLLRQVEQKSRDEIARMPGIEKTSVSTLLARARAKMLNEIRKRNGL